jgi:CHASE2 domain-containing sensor protein
MNKSQKPVSPVPQWMIALPLVGAVVAAIIVVSGQPGPLTLAIFFISLFVLGYLYFYLIGVWHRHRSKHEVS